MKIQVAELTAQGNQMLKKLEQLEANSIESRATEGYFLSRSIAEVLVARGILTADDLVHSSTKMQLDALGLEEKVDHDLLEMGDVALIQFSLWHEGEMVDDQTKEPLGYQMGSHQLPCEDEMLGMKVDEDREFQVSFGAGFRFPHLIDKPCQLKVKLLAIRTAPKLKPET